MRMLALGLMAVSAPAAALSQETTSPPSQDVSTAAPYQGGPQPPTREAAPLLRGVSTELEFDNDKSTATLQFGQVHANRIAVTPGRDPYISGYNWSASFSAPVGGDDDVTDLSSLSDGLKLTVAFGWFGYRSGAASVLRFMEHDNPLFDSAVQNCTRQLTAAHREAEIADECHPALHTLDFVRQYGGVSRSRLNRLVLHGVTFGGIDLSVGANDFKYFDLTTLAATGTTEANFGAGVYVGHYFRDGVSGIRANVAYENGYEALDARVICRAVVANPADDCVNGAPGAPNHVERLNFSLEARRLFELGRAGSIGASPKATVDALSGDYELALPIYYVPPGDSAIAPGVSVTYSSRTDDVEFGIFLKTAFKLIF
jgi:hypothetical protein